MSYKGITPTPRNWRHKKFEIHIWSWRPSRRSKTHGKRIPRTTTTKYGPPFVGIWFITFHRPEGMMTQNGRVASLLICVHQSKTTNRSKREKWFKIDNIINSHIPTLWSYVFNSSDNKYIGLFLIYTRTTDISNIHRTHWPFILTRNDQYAYTINTCQCKPQQIEELKSVRCFYW
jgi:hypothetical protein